MARRGLIVSMPGPVLQGTAEKLAQKTDRCVSLEAELADARAAKAKVDKVTIAENSALQRRRCLWPKQLTSLDFVQLGWGPREPC